MDMMDDGGAGIPEPAERMMCGEMFPGGGFPEIWLNVFDKLDRKDKPAFAEASSVWHDMVEAKRTEILVNEIAPILMEGLPSRNLLQSRELCQAWEEEWIHQNESISSTLHPPPCIQTFDNVFRNSEKVQEFMEEMRGHPGNPFPTRSIRLSYSFNDEDGEQGDEWAVRWRDYFTNIGLLLEKFGPHIHFAEIIFNEDEEPQAALQLQGPEIDALLREGLILLPNLKVVSISGECSSPLQDQDVREFYRLNPLPRLEHLELVDLPYGSPVMVDEFLKCCCVPENIKLLSYNHGRIYGDRLIFSEAVYGFVNLEVLKAPILLRQLKRLAHLDRRPPLRILELTFEDGPQDFQAVFSLLEQFSETLTLFSAFSIIRGRNNGGQFTCNLPNLKTLFFVEYWGSPELLFQLKAVSHLQIFQMKDANRRVVRDLETRMNASNIWMMMPSLQKMTLGDRGKTQERNDGLKWKLMSWNFRSVLIEMVTSAFMDHFSGSLF